MTTPDFSNWTCPLPLRDHPNIVMGHGGGGKLSAELIAHLFMPALGNETLAGLGDSSVLGVNGSSDGPRIAFSTDSFVVRPLFFPGGSIGDLAVNGTVNDIAMSGATPLYLSAGFIIEEGLPLSTLAGIVERMREAADQAGVQIVTGDTKVVERGHGDGVYINTAGIGIVPAGVYIAPKHAKPGDVVIVSGTLGDHGMAVMSLREGLEFDTTIESDSAALNGLVKAMLDAAPDGGIHVLRDPTRGGLASALNEIAESAQVGVELVETAIPVQPAVRAACEMLGMDPMYVACEGRLVAVVDASAADAVYDAMRAHPHGAGAAVVGRVVESHPGMLVAKTALGATRVVDMQVGEQLPRIC